MKKILNKLIRNEEGQAMILALILLVVGGLIIAPLLGYMSTGLKVGQVYEKKMDELYAADAGVEDAIWKIQDIERLKSLIQQVDPGYSPPAPGGWDEWTLEDYPWPLPSYNLGDNVNDKGVGVTIDYLDADKAFKITSVASSDDSSTTIESILSSVYGDYSGILDNAITSQGDITLLGPTTVTPGEGEEHGPVADYDGDWPTPEELSAFYWEDVKDEVPYASGTLDVNDYAATGDSYQ